MEYIGYPHKDRKSDYGVSFPDFPGCVTAGKTLDEARRLAAEALGLHIEGMMEDREAIPESSTLDALAEDPAMSGAVAFLVHVEVADKAVPFNITARAEGRHDAVGVYCRLRADASKGVPARPRGPLNCCGRSASRV